MHLSIDDCRSYATEANLDKAIAKHGLDNWTDSTRHGQHTCRYMKVRNSEGRWTAIFLVSEHANLCGGYIGFAAQHGFMSV